VPTGTRAVGMLLFFGCVGMAVLTGRLAPVLGPGAHTAKLAVRGLGVTIAVILWILMSLPVYRRRATA